MIERLFSTQGQETEEHWVSISDVMTGLMVIFLFIAISYMVNAKNKTDRIDEQLQAYAKLREDLSKELEEEFEGTREKREKFREEWRGHLDKTTLAIGFKEQFPQGKAHPPNAFRAILRDFIPRYIGILTKAKYKDEISEIRIEGHTSSEWFEQVTGNEAYIRNMELSQNRARNVLDYVLWLAHRKDGAWLRKHLTAHGLSSSQLRLNLDAVYSRPTNTYRIVERESGISSGEIRQLHQQIRRLSKDSRGSREDVVATLRQKLPGSEYSAVDIERAVDLLMENRGESRRVEFRVVTKSEKLIEELRQVMKLDDRLGEID